MKSTLPSLILVGLVVGLISILVECYQTCSLSIVRAIELYGIYPQRCPISLSLRCLAWSSIKLGWLVLFIVNGFALVMELIVSFRVI